MSLTFPDLFAEPGPNNTAWTLVNYILPSDTSTAYGQALAVFASFLTLAASGFIGWNILQGIVHSAYTGKVLGDKFHQIWAPLRVVLGFGLMVPIDGGFSSAHYVVRDIIARPAINIADAVWVSFVDQIAVKGTPIRPVSVNGSTIVLNILGHEICLAVQVAVPKVEAFPVSFPDANGIEADGRVVWNYGSDCGRFSFSIPAEQVAYSDARRLAIATVITSARTQATQYGKAFALGQPMDSPDTAMQGIATSMLPAEIATSIRNAGKAYDAAIVTAAAVVASQQDADTRAKLRDAAEQQGWMHAGEYYEGLAQISEETVSLASESPEEVAPRIGEMSGYGDQVKLALAALRHQITGEESKINVSANDLASAGDASADFLTKILGPITRDFGEWVTSVQSSDDPMGSLISSGHMMIGWAKIGVMAGAAVSVASGNWFSQSLGVGAAATWLLDWAKLAIGALWILGAFRAFILPFLPYLYTFTAAMMWLISIAELSLAVLCWSFLMCRMDGDTFLTKDHAQGGMIMINILLRPALTVLALISSYLIFPAVINTLNESFGRAFFGQQGGHVVDIDGIILAIAIQTYLIWFFAIRVFGATAAIADRVAHWIGVPGGASMGESGMAQAAVTGAVALASRGTPGALPRMAGQQKDKKPEDEDSSAEIRKGKGS